MRTIRQRRTTSPSCQAGGAAPPHLLERTSIGCPPAADMAAVDPVAVHTHMPEHQALNENSCSEDHSAIYIDRNSRTHDKRYTCYGRVGRGGGGGTCRLKVGGGRPVVVKLFVVLVELGVVETSHAEP